MHWHQSKIFRLRYIDTYSSTKSILFFHLLRFSPLDFGWESIPHLLFPKMMMARKISAFKHCAHVKQNRHKHVINIHPYRKRAQQFPFMVSTSVAFANGITHTHTLNKHIKCKGIKWHHIFVFIYM